MEKQTNQVMNTNDYRQVRTDIEVSPRAGRVFCVIGYETHHTLSRLSEEIRGTRHHSLVRALRSLYSNLLC